MMSSDAKTALSNTIGTLRLRLLEDLDKSVESKYRLGIDRIEAAGLAPHIEADRRRLFSWWNEQVRADATSEGERNAADFRAELQAEAAYTWLHRLVVLRLMEEAGIVKPALVKNGWDSSAYREFRDWSPELLGDDSEGFGRLLRLVFDELAIDLPGLFGPGILDLIPMPPATLRAIIDALNDKALDECWSDDTTLGWVYQFWNDPTREALDAKVKTGGKIESYEIASKTQFFTDRYIAEWMIQNSLGTMWLAMCENNSWTADVKALETLDRLEANRADWRAKREAGEVELDVSMPVGSKLEERWKYWVPQSLPAEAVQSAPTSIRDLKLLDPAVGSGHFLVIAFDYLFALYEEEARHRGESWTAHDIVAQIIEHNLYGIDIDARCIQIAAASLYLKGRAKVKSYRPRVLNLVVPNLPLARLPANDPVLLIFRNAVEEETGIDAEFVDTILDALKEAYHLGSLLKVEAVIGDAMRNYQARSLDLERSILSVEDARDILLNRLESFLDHHTSRDDLGLALQGAQLAAGIRFVRMILAADYDIVIANPPYQSTSKLKHSDTFKAAYPLSSTDLFAGFGLRASQLGREHGINAQVTLANWMYLSSFKDFRIAMMERNCLASLADLGTGAFSSGSKLIRTSAQIFWIGLKEHSSESVAIRALEAHGEQQGEVTTTTAALLAQVGRYKFSADALKGIKDQPLIYWWNDAFLKEYIAAPKMGEIYPAWQGIATTDNTRFIRRVWEVKRSEVLTVRIDEAFEGTLGSEWVPYIKGAAGCTWVEPLDFVIRWAVGGWKMNMHLEYYRETHPALHLKEQDNYFRPIVAFTTIGKSFTARTNVYRSVVGHKAQCIFPDNVPDVLCCLNSRRFSETVESLNPGIGFEVSDINRAPFLVPSNSSALGKLIFEGYALHERTRETSIDFIAPAESHWDELKQQCWHELGRIDQTSTPSELPLSIISLSFAVGVAIGRLSHDDQGWLEQAPKYALPHGILYLSVTDNPDVPDSLKHKACSFLNKTWSEYGTEVTKKHNLNSWLREKWFKDVHISMYEKRPIYLPLSSANKNFVAHVSIHRWTIDTLRHLLADYLIPEKNSLEGLKDDMARLLASEDVKTKGAAEDHYAKVTGLLNELSEFIRNVQECAEKGPPPTDQNPKKCPPREVDQRYDPKLDDGVMINAAALWPLLEPQWKEPKTWWNQLSTQKGVRGKHFDWAHLAKNYWPTRVDLKCTKDPSLAVAHGCFWKYHVERAYEWELRLQNEIEPDFRIDEDESDLYRTRLLEQHPERATEIHDAELRRREKQEKKNADSKQEVFI